jgi:hypothetical protein
MRRRVPRGKRSDEAEDIYRSRLSRDFWGGMTFQLDLTDKQPPECVGSDLVKNLQRERDIKQVEDTASTSVIDILLVRIIKAFYGVQQ